MFTSKEIRISCFLFASGVAGNISAFDYLEHSLITDRACYETLNILAANMQSASTGEKGRYLALALMCPGRWKPDYCSHGKKNVSGSINSAERHAITLGDYSALVDHITEYGRIQTIPGAAEPGLVDLTWRWLIPGQPTGVARDIAEEECRLDTVPDWNKVESDVDSFFRTWYTHKRPAGIEPALMTEGRRAEIMPGPADPSTLFAIRNPRFLDLQLFNQTHFGANAYRTWTGMHHTAISVSTMRCEDALDVAESTARKLAQTLPEFKNMLWDNERNPEYRSQTCRLLGGVLRLRLKEWQRSADPRLVAPVRGILADLTGEHPSSEARQILQALPVHVAALVFEGTGAHFLQDALSGGHVRTEHNGRSLNTTRRYHDIDSKNGVAVTLAARENRYDFVVFGDTYLLGSTQPPLRGTALDMCEKAPQGLVASPQRVASCLLSYQRGMVTAANAASLVDWGLGGIMYNPENMLRRTGAKPDCPKDTGARAFVCTFLPLQPIAPTATAPSQNTGYLAREGLPPTPPPVDFQSLRIESSLDGAGYGTQLGARLEFLTPFVRRGGDWLYSYDFGFLMTLGDPGRQQLIHEFAFTFHYRLATRFLLSTGPLTYIGFEGFSSRTNFFFGMGLGAGVTILPEGWTKIPLQLTLSYRAPWRFVDTNRGFDSEKVEAHWIGLSAGLAFL